MNSVGGRPECKTGYTCDFPQVNKIHIFKIVSFFLIILVVKFFQDKTTYTRLIMLVSKF